MRDQLPSLNALHAFDAAAHSSSFSQAARQLHVTHGAISRQVHLLEAQLGVRLFSKEGRGVRLTAAGLQLHEATRAAFASLRSTCDTLQRQRPEAPFVLGCPGSLLARWFIPRLERLNRELPGLRLQLCATEGPPDPKRPGLDASLWFAEPPWPTEGRILKLAAERIGPVLSPLYPNHQYLREAPASALLAEPLLHTDSRPQAWPNWMAAQQLPLATVQLGQRFEHLYYLLEAALAGLGVAIAPHLLVADDLANGRLIAPWGFVETGAHLVLLAANLADQRTDALATWLSKELSTSSC